MRRRRTLAAAITAALVIAGASASSPAGVESRTLEVGAPAPELSLRGHDGARHDLAALSGEERALVVFYRGAW
jgi:hypothetical protein